VEWETAAIREHILPYSIVSSGGDQYNHPDHKLRPSHGNIISEKAFLPSRVASHITAKLIVVPDVKKSNAGPAKVPPGVSFHTLLPFKDIFLHRCNVW
jgi:hypothetical protein